MSEVIEKKGSIAIGPSIKITKCCVITREGEEKDLSDRITNININISATDGLIVKITFYTLNNEDFQSIVDNNLFVLESDHAYKKSYPCFIDFVSRLYCNKVHITPDHFDYMGTKPRNVELICSAIPSH